MPNTKSAIKAMHQSRRRQEINQKTKSKVKNSVRDFRKAIEAKDTEKAQNSMKKATSAIDKASKKGLIHKNKANRDKSRMAKRIQTIK